MGDVGVVESAFGGDGCGGGVGAGMAAFRHHRPAPTAGFDDGWVASPQGGRRCAQCREQVQATRIRRVGVPSR